MPHRSKIPVLSLAAFLCGGLVLIQACVSTGQRVPDLYRLEGDTRMGALRLAEGTVTAHRDSPSGTAYRFPILPDGSFSMELPRGTYYVTGEGRTDTAGGELWSFYSGNPLAVYGPAVDPLVLRFAPLPPPPGTAAAQIISGSIVHEGAPLAGAAVGVYLDHMEGFHGPPFAVSLPSDGDGRFSLTVPSGTYYLLARMRPRGGAFHGPLLKGDLAGYYPRNPVTVRGEGGLDVVIPVVEVNRPRGEGSHSLGQAVLVQGTIRLESGQPTAGLRVYLYQSPDMLGRPSFVSSPSDAQGRYSLEVSQGGLYYLVARERIGGPPETGDLMGFYPGSADHSLTLQWGDRLDQVDFTVRETF